jgi:NhaA family Na+:H+ antiporter
MLKNIHRFLHWEAASGVLLVIAAILAMLVVNSPLQPFYNALLNIPLEISLGSGEISKPLLLWVNDGLMALFFLMVGLEIKREVVQGQLSSIKKVTLPIMAAIGGIAVPALIYAALNWDDPLALKGWAIPAATDIAFALGVLSLLGSRVPPALKLFLLTLAIIDDLGAIVIIALFYTTSLSLTSLGIALLAMIGLFILNRLRVTALTPYLLIGLVMWVAVLKSGVHATLAGVVIALFIPPYRTEPGQLSLAERLENDLHPSVAFLILPVFAFMNTGVSLSGLSFSSLLTPVPLGIILGLFLGKQIGVMLFSWLAVTFRIAHLPDGVTWLQLYGVAMLSGIGFTMSLFISSLAFEQGDPNFVVDDRLGILVGSTLSAVAGYLLLKGVLPKPRQNSTTMNTIEQENTSKN